MPKFFTLFMVLTLHKPEEAANFYTAIFEKGAILRVKRTTLRSTNLKGTSLMTIGYGEPNNHWF